MSFFDPKDEIAARFVSAAEFGFEPHWWGCLVQSVNCCQMLAQVEPILLSHLTDNRPGASLLLYGQRFEWELVCDLAEEELSLFRSPLDPPSEPVQVFHGFALGINNWRVLTCLILNEEGFVGKAFEDFDREMSRTGRAPWVWRKI
jgi:hypothetical protein